MQISPAGLSLIKEFERLVLFPYDDGYGFMTIGWGHRIRKDENFRRITQSEADALLRADVAEAERIVNRAVKVPLNQNQFDALVSFCFNVGPGKAGYKDGFVELKSGGQSSMLRLLNDGNFPGASQQFGRWINAAGKPSAGLRRRREAERALFDAKPTKVN